jgi:hypothetical protein
VNAPESRGAFISMENFMLPSEIDRLVQASAAMLDRDDVSIASIEVDAQVNGRAWNMNQPLNMIAFEDQQ